MKSPNIKYVILLFFLLTICGVWLFYQKQERAKIVAFNSLVKSEVSELSITVRLVIEDHMGELPDKLQLFNELRSRYGFGDVGIFARFKSRLRAGEIFDPNGRPYQITMPDSRNFRILSVGYNGVFENGGGDDLVFVFPTICTVTVFA